MRSYPRPKHKHRERRIFSNENMRRFLPPEGRDLMQKDDMKHTGLSVKDRNRLTLNGVNNIASFDESYVVLETSEGKICIEGSGLKIESLAREGGELEITGRINGVFYTQNKKGKSPFSKLFG